MFQSLLGKLGVEFKEGFSNFLEEEPKNKKLEKTENVSEGDKLGFQISLSLQKGSIVIRPSNDPRQPVFITNYEGIEVNLSQSMKFIWFETDIQDCRVMIKDRSKNQNYEVLKRVEEGSKQKLVKILYEKPKTAGEQTQEKLQVFVDSVAFVFYSEILSNMAQQLKVKSIIELQKIANLQKFNVLAAASKVYNIIYLWCTKFFFSSPQKDHLRDMIKRSPQMNLDITIESTRVMYPLKLTDPALEKLVGNNLVLMLTVDILNVTTPQNLNFENDTHFHKRDPKLYDTVQVYFEGLGVSILRDHILNDARLQNRARKTIFNTPSFRKSGIHFTAAMKKAEQTFHIIENLTCKLIIHKLKQNAMLFSEYSSFPAQIIKGEIVQITANFTIPYLTALSKLAGAKKESQGQATPQSKRGRRSTVRDDLRRLHSNRIEVSLRMNEINLNFQADEEEPWLIFRARNIRLIQFDKLAIMGITVLLNSIELLEVLSDRTTNTLVYVEQSAEASSDDKIEITIPKEEVLAQKQKIDINFSVVYFYWKPDYTKQLMAFLWSSLKKKDSSDPSLSRSVSAQHYMGSDHLFPRSVSTQPFGVGYSDAGHISSIVVFRANSFCVNFGFNDYTLFKLAVNKIGLQIVIRKARLEVEGKVDEFSLHDMTNYPETTLNLYDMLEDQMGEKNFDTTLASGKLDFSYVSFDRTSPQWQTASASKLGLDLKDLKLAYFQQPIMRIINYFLNHFLPVLSKPQSQLPEDAFVRITSPGFMAIRVTAEKPVLLLYNHPGSSTHLECHLEYLSVSNKSYLNTEKAPKDAYDSIWFDNYIIRISSLKLHMKNEQSSHYLAHVPALNILIDKMTMVTDYKNFTPHISKSLTEQQSNRSLAFDRTITVSLKFHSLELFWRSFDYQFIQRLLADNINFDDQQEEMIHVSDPTAPSSKKFVLNRDSLTNIISFFHSGPLDIRLSFGSAALFFLNEKAHPIMDFFSRGATISVFKRPDRKMDIQIAFDDLLLHYLTFNPYIVELRQISAMNPSVKSIFSMPMKFEEDTRMSISQKKNNGQNDEQWLLMKEVINKTFKDGYKTQNTCITRDSVSSEKMDLNLNPVNLTVDIAFIAKDKQISVNISNLNFFADLGRLIWAKGFFTTIPKEIASRNLILIRLHKKLIFFSLNSETTYLASGWFWQIESFY